MTIWLIGGTQESAELAQAIVSCQWPCVVTMTTDSARSLYPIAPTLRLWVGQLNLETIRAFIHIHAIHCIIDASHPFAVAVSELAVSTAKQHQIPYLRYERPSLKKPDTAPGNQPKIAAQPHPQPKPSQAIFHLKDVPDLLAGDYLTGQRVLLTIGYRLLSLFHAWHDRAELFARILPSTTALQAALAAQFTNDRLIAIRPPISAALEKALWQQWNISTVVTKASGTAGGEDVKQQVAKDLGVTLIVIDRPSIAYPQQTSSIEAALAFCTQFHSPPLP